MTELVRAGKIYIAQPPLYQIKRKKREEYVEDDVQLNKILISLGAEDVRLKNLADKKEITAAQLKDILESLEKLAKLSEAVRRHGGDFEEFLSHREKRSEEAAFLSRQNSRWQRRIRPLFPRRTRSAEVSRRKSRSQFVRYRDGPGVVAADQCACAQQRRPPPRQARRAARVDHHSETDRRAGAKGFESGSLRRK